MSPDPTAPAKQTWLHARQRISKSHDSSAKRQLSEAPSLSRLPRLVFACFSLGADFHLHPPRLTSPRFTSTSTPTTPIPGGGEASQPLNF
ncbi:hypothetical protein PAAG_02654 [Paracoccidioides lutzii Pb01]|uniref:Uncharacterized protein n=1 Tax=Paracoccidioides lutzii (strain ATCC MYA-826 / Pb01) TaxID=502779 RepID=C1GVV9_PARBA|nr:hypothetical protein PAAG_02654 [Paracoccidioides lutzii Pb01]EEH40678.1 hypothetical protein PAAG_02654 [Paracoccidioides lutzii Pb01]